MPAESPPSVRVPERELSGLWYAGGGFVVAVLLSALIGGSVLAAGDWTSDDAPIWVRSILQVPLWVGLTGAVFLWSRRNGTRSLANDVGLRSTMRDVPVGFAIGIAAQYAVNYAISWPVVKLSGTSFTDYEEPARRLADAAHASSWWGVVLFVVMVVVGAPLVEELFYRGLLQRTCLAAWSAPVAVAVAAVAFGLSHFQLLQLPALVAFGLLLGYLVHRSGRLGPAIWAHAGFNATAAATMLWQAANR